MRDNSEETQTFIWAGRCTGCASDISVTLDPQGNHHIYVEHTKECPKQAEWEETLGKYRQG